MEDGTRYDSLRRLESQKLSAVAFSEAEEESRPFVLSDVVGPDFCTWWAYEAEKKLGPQPIFFIDCDALAVEKTVMEGTFSVFVEENRRLSNRSHYAYVLMDNLSERAPDAAASLLRNLPAALPAKEGNLFQRWPHALKPPLLELMVAGTGARSRLTCEGLQASQWLLCLSGRMRLKLLPDERHRLNGLDIRSDPIGIFDEKGQSIFEVGVRLSSEIDLFATEFVGSTPATHLDSYGPDLQRWPNAGDLPRALEVLLKPGELLIVPGGWWAQRYFDEQSWVLSAQYLNARSLDSVLRSMLEHNRYTADVVPNPSIPPEERIDMALIMVLGTKTGNGRQLLEKLRHHERSKNEEVERHQDSMSAADTPVCAVCGRPARTQCGRCRKLQLCGTECQRRCWPEHKKVCIKAA